MWKRRFRLPMWGTALILSAVLLAIVIPMMPPPLPKKIRIGTGVAGGYYETFGERLATRLRSSGFEVELIPSEGSAENVRRLQGEEPSVDCAFVQGGLSSVIETDGIQGIASLFYEPIWVFLPKGNPVGLLSELAGKRIGIGKPGSGTAPLARTVLHASGIRNGENGTQFLPFGREDGFDALRQGKIDALFLVQAATDAWLEALIDAAEFDTVTFQRAPAYASRFRHLEVIQVPRGFASLEKDLPRRDVEILATTANLAVRSEIHPQLIPFLIEQCQDELAQGTMLAAPGVFPSIDHIDIPVSESAVRFYRRGPGWLYRNLPFFVAHAVDRLLILLIPLLTLLYPLIKGVGPLYRWVMFRRVYPWYRVLRELEEEAETADTPEQRREILRQLREMDDAVSDVKVPPRFAGELYSVRRHIALVEGHVRRHEEA